jgi:hypothetical protein
MIATYGDEVVALLFHPESKMLGPDGEAYDATTTGLLTPRPVQLRAVHLVGREGNRTDEVATGEVVEPDEVLTEYGDYEWQRIPVPAARRIGGRRLARMAGLAPSTVADLRAGRAVPRLSTRLEISEHVVRWQESS